MLDFALRVGAPPSARLVRVAKQSRRGRRSYEDFAIIVEFVASCSTCTEKNTTLLSEPVKPKRAR